MPRDKKEQDERKDRAEKIPSRVQVCQEPASLMHVIKGDQGCPGDMGVRGHSGKRGKRGKHGKHGEQGEKGNQGEKGEKGDQGEKGEKGDQGGQGTSGPAGTPAVSDYIFAQNSVEQIVAPAANVVLNTVLNTTGITYDSVLNQFNLVQAGVYKVSYAVETAGQYGLTLNAVVNLNSVNTSVGQAIFTASAGDVLALTNLLTVPVTVALVTVVNGTQQSLNVTMIVERLA